MHCCKLWTWFGQACLSMWNLQPSVQRPRYSDAFTRQEPFALNFRWLVRVWCLLNTFSACSNRITELLSCFCSFFIKLSIAFLAQFSSSSPETTHTSCCLSRWFIESCKQGRWVFASNCSALCSYFWIFDTKWIFVAQIPGWMFIVWTAVPRYPTRTLNLTRIEALFRCTVSRTLIDQGG